MITRSRSTTLDYSSSDYRRPAEGYASGEAFTSSGEVAEQLRRAYGGAEALYFGRDAYPSWAAILERVQAAYDLL